MRLLVVSDTHGNAHSLQEAVLAHPEATALIHLGDGAREAENLADRFPSLPLYQVRGNVDFAASHLLDKREETFGTKRVFFTHGHLYRVKFGLQSLDYAARERQAELVLFGHTHQPLATYEDGVYFVNPGSLGYDRRYATVDIVSGGVFPLLHTLR